MELVSDYVAPVWLWIISICIEVCWRWWSSIFFLSYWVWIRNFSCLRWIYIYSGGLRAAEVVLASAFTVGGRRGSPDIWNNLVWHLMEIFRPVSRRWSHIGNICISIEDPYEVLQTQNPCSFSFRKGNLSYRPSEFYLSVFSTRSSNSGFSYIPNDEIDVHLEAKRIQLRYPEMIVCNCH